MNNTTLPIYSILHSALLVPELVLHPTGFELVDVLDQSLRIDRDQLVELGEYHREDRSYRLAYKQIDALLAPDSSSPLMTGIDLPALLDCIREDFLGWSSNNIGDLTVTKHTQGIRAVCDAITVAWAGNRLTPEVADRLTASWRNVFGELPTVSARSAYGPQSSILRAMIDQLSTMPESSFVYAEDAQRISLNSSSGVRVWSIALRRAIQAAFVTGRAREVAAAQLAAARALFISGQSNLQTAQIVSGCTQAVTMRDALEPTVYMILIAPWEDLVGSIPTVQE